MKYNPDLHRRQSIRLKGYDYTQPGAYFVTICTAHQAHLFGTVTEDDMQLSTAGTMVWQWWEELNRKFPTVRTDVAVVMPNHFHGIIVIDQPQQAQSDVGKILGDRPVDGQPRPVDGQPHRAAPTEKAPSLGDIVGWFKTMTTNAYIKGVRQQGWPPFQGAVWQRNYYEHVIRQGQAIERIREYIQANPVRWTWDRENLQRTGLDQMELWIFSSPPDKGLSQ